MSRPIEAMTTAAQGLAYTPYSQEKEGGQAICYGLTVVWLNAKKKGKPNNQTFKTQANGNSDLWSQSKGYYETQMTPTWCTDFGFTHVENQSFSYAQEMKEFVDWVNGGVLRGARYFMVNVGGQTSGHSMGAYGSLTGNLEFFDPNCGIVEAKKKSDLVTCLSGYFNEEPMKTKYKSNAFTLNGLMYKSS